MPPHWSPCRTASQRKARARKRATSASSSNRRALLILAERVPHSLEPTLVAGVKALADRTPPCVPAVPAISTSPPSSTTRKGHGHGHGKHGDGHGDGGGD